MDGIAGSVKKGDDCLRFYVDDKKSKSLSLLEGELRVRPRQEIVSLRTRRMLNGLIAP